MKVRSGFVSNSSSSSFVIAYKEKGVVEKKIDKILSGIEPGNIFFSLLGPVKKRLLRDLTRSRLDSLYNSEDSGCENLISEEKVHELRGKGFQIFVGGISDQDEWDTDFLANVEIHFEDDEFFLSKESGY